MTTKEKIKEYVDDHFNCFGFFPCDVEVDGKVYLYEEYRELMKKDVLKIGLDVDEEENNSEEAE